MARRPPHQQITGTACGRMDVDGMEVGSVVLFTAVAGSLHWLDCQPSPNVAGGMDGIVLVVYVAAGRRAEPVDEPPTVPVMG